MGNRILCDTGMSRIVVGFLKNIPFFAQNHNNSESTVDILIFFIKN